jgi:hypothetical protein
VEETFEISAKLSTFHHGQIIGERMYVNPVIFSRMASNPFRSENRSYPVDFGYPYTTVEETELSVPMGFRVEEVPEDVSFKMTGAKFDLSFSADSAQVRCVRRLTVIQPVCRPYLYVALRKFFEKIVSADRQQVVLVKEPG